MHFTPVASQPSILQFIFDYFIKIFKYVKILMDCHKMNAGNKYGFIKTASGCSSLTGTNGGPILPRASYQ
jgi:hypothetical protein